MYYAIKKYYSWLAKYSMEYFTFVGNKFRKHNEIFFSYFNFSNSHFNDIKY